VGAGLSLWPNGMSALDRIGLGAQVRRRSVRDVDSALRSPSGELLVAADSSALERLLGDVSLVIHRAELLALLQAALPSDSVLTAAACTGFEESKGGVIARFADGSRVRARFVIGADGMHSTVRSALFGERAPRYAGYTAFRGLVRFDHRKLRAGISVGRGCQFGQAPMADGQVYWFATENAQRGHVAAGKTRREKLLERFADWHDPIPELIAATDEHAILHHDVFDREPLPTWGRGLVSLLGDAAHPMTPNLGQGANQALEDAVALADALRHGAAGELEGALRSYEEARRERANQVVLASRRVGRAMQLQSSWACAVRDALLKTRKARARPLDQIRRGAAAQPRRPRLTLSPS
jgi:2-polyprenyl-6-methoxyphenol hydroxylase-like FAD-dependent oxidoreductase